MPCPLCSTDSVSAVARRREAESTRDAAERLASEVLRMAQAVRDISARLRHGSGGDPDAADMLDDLARRMAAETTHALTRMIAA